MPPNLYNYNYISYPMVHLCIVATVLSVVTLYATLTIWSMCSATLAINVVEPNSHVHVHVRVRSLYSRFMSVNQSISCASKFTSSYIAASGHLFMYIYLFLSVHCLQWYHLLMYITEADDKSYIGAVPTYLSLSVCLSPSYI